jgi:thiol-disulfide isomerase/thioredoxin
MSRFALALALLALTTSSPAQEPGPTTTRSASIPLVVKVKQNPDDTEALNAYFREQSQAIVSLLQTDVDKAERALAAFKKQLVTLVPTKDNAKALVQRAKARVGNLEDQIEVARTALPVLQERLRANVDDATALTKYFMKVAQEASPNFGSRPEEAKKQIASVREFLKGLRPKAKAETQTRIDDILKHLDATEALVDPEAAHAKLVGRKAAPLEVEAWVNGSPVTDDELKGKVVLLDFWAVWCGPCIATFPHLREWNEKYADKGLVMIGLTNYYNFHWDEKADKAAHSEEKVPPEQEQAMLAKFAARHKMTHRIAVQRGDALSKYYGVAGIPQVVVIDREGVVRLIKFGGGEDNAKAIGELLAKLLEPGKSAGE